MARVEITLTAAYQQIAAVQNTLTVKSNAPRTTLFVNDASSDVAAHKVRPEPNYQLVQTSATPTFAKGEGIVIIVDEAI